MIRICYGVFELPVSQRVIYATLLEKLYPKGMCIFAYNGQALGYCAFYANDSEQKNAYVSLIAVATEYQKKHIETKLLRDSFEMMRACGMNYCMLEVRKNNKNAIRFYEMNHFVMIEECEKSYLMKCEL